MKGVLSKLFSGASLGTDEAQAAMEKVIAGGNAPEQVASFLGALRAKGESVDELVGFARALRKHKIGIRSRRTGLTDTCGTGGDGLGTFNVSTTCAFVVAGAGVAVAKHGNRAVSSRCGSSEVLEALGIPMHSEPAPATATLDETGLVFLHAPAFHPALAQVAPIRRAIGVRTVFNLLGPLCNPADVKRQLLGVSDSRFVVPLARALLALGAENALVVCGQDGCDEVALHGSTRAAHATPEGVRELELCPESFGLERGSAADLAGGDAQENAAITLSILRGDRGAKREIVVLNSAAAIVVSGRTTDFKEAAEHARRSIDSGAALALLEILRKRG